MQRIVLVESLSDNPKRKTYDQIATETGYSSKYIKQVVAPQLWQLLSDTTGQRVLKSNVRNILIPLLSATPSSTVTADANAPASDEDGPELGSKIQAESTPQSPSLLGPGLTETAKPKETDTQGKAEASELSADISPIQNPRLRLPGNH